MVGTYAWLLPVAVVCIGVALCALVYYYWQRLVAWYTTAVQFLRDVRSELRKVTFPTRKETLASTMVVLAVVFIIAVYLGVVDFGLSLVLGSILK